MDLLLHSPLLVPLLPWLATPVVLFFAFREVGPVQRLVRIFAGVLVLDAWLGGAWSPLAGHPTAARLVPWLFVMLGDLRYLVMLEVIVGGARKAAMKRTLALVTIGPVLALVASASGFAPGEEDRIAAFAHHFAFVAVAFGLRAFWLPRRVERASPFTQRVAFGLTDFEIAQCGLFAASDMLLLSGPSLEELGTALRIVPTLLFYVGYLPTALWLTRASSSPTS